MITNDSLLKTLEEISGPDYVSNQPEELYLYSRAPSGIRKGVPDYLVLPGTAKEISAIVHLAREKQIPIIPWGGGLSLSDLTIPLRGGIVLDMNRMDSIIEVDERRRYAVVEAGITVGRLVGYLKQHHPSVRISVPDAPPAATMCGNAILFGSGHLSKYGAHSEMIIGLEAVLHDGEICNIGHCASDISGQPWSPDFGLRSLFTNWFGATGVITKFCISLYPAHRLREAIIFKIEAPESIPLAIQRTTATGLGEDVLIFAMKQKESRIPMTLLQLFVTADSDTEMEEKRAILKKLFDDCRIRGRKILPIDNSLFPSEFIDNLMDEPKRGIEESVDAKAGGGCAYVGACFPLESIPAAYKMGLSISEKFGFTGPLYTIRNVGVGHSVIFTFMYPFNRVDDDSVEIMKRASDEASVGIRELGGVLWKASIEKQKMLYELMDPGTRSIISRIKHGMDPDRIFNPGNWEPEENKIAGSVFESSELDDTNPSGRPMSRIISVNSESRYGVIEPGVTIEQLGTYLKEHHPNLAHGLISSAPSELIIDSMISRGKHAKQALYGTADNMLQGVEVTLPDGAVAKLGSCSTSSLWFSNGPVPEVQRLLLHSGNSLGTITKLGLRLFPAPKCAESFIYILKKIETLPAIIERALHLEMADQIIVVGKEAPSYMKGVVIVALVLTAADEEALSLKRKMFKTLFSRKEALFKDGLKSEMLDVIFEPIQPSIGFSVPLNAVPAVWKTCAELIHASSGKFLYNFSVLDHGRNIFGEISFASNKNSSGDELSKYLKESITDIGCNPYPPLRPSPDTTAGKLFDSIGRAIVNPSGMDG